MFNKINFKNLLGRNKVTTQILPTDYVGLMRRNDKTNGEFEQSVISAKDLTADIVKNTLSQIPEVAIPPQPLYTEVDISAADIDGASNYIVKELLPSLEDAGQYYAFKEVLVEFHKGTVAFTPESGRMYFTDGDNSYQIGDWGMGFLATLDDKVCEIPVGAQEYPDTAAPTARFTPMSDLDWRYIYIYITQASFTDSLGDGTMKVKMTYTIETFG